MSVGPSVFNAFNKATIRHGCMACGSHLRVGFDGKCFNILEEVGVKMSQMIIVQQTRCREGTGIV